MNMLAQTTQAVADAVANTSRYWGGFDLTIPGSAFGGALAAAFLFLAGRYQRAADPTIQTRDTTSYIAMMMICTLFIGGILGWIFGSPVAFYLLRLKTADGARAAAGAIGFGGVPLAMLGQAFITRFAGSQMGAPSK